MKKLTTLLLMALMVTGLQAQINSSLPNVTVRTLEGRDINVATLSNDGKPFILTFWDMHCRSCMVEHNTLNDVYPDWQAETGVKIYSINTDDSRQTANIRPFVEGRNWGFEFLLDVNKELDRAMNVNNMHPYTFLFDGQGRLVYLHNGFNPGDEDVLYEEILKLVH